MILDTFYVLFKSDSKDLQEGSKKAIKSTEDVEKALKKTDQTASSLGGTFSGLIRQATGALAAFLSVGAIMGGVRAAIQYTTYIAQMSEHLGYGADVLDAWGGAVEKAGGTAYAFQTSVQNLDIALEEAARTGEGETLKAFNRLGISIRDAKGEVKDFITVAPELARAFEGLNRSESSALGYKLGLDYGTIMLLQKGQAEIDALIKREKELGVVTKQDTEASQKFSLQTKDTTHAFRSFFVAISTEILPVLQKVFKFFEGVAIYLREHKHIVIGTVIGIAASLTAYLIPAIFGVGGAAGIISKIFSKWTIVIAIIAAISSAIGVLYDDFIIFKKGGDSVIGDLVKKYPELIEIFNGIGQAIGWATGLFKDFNITPLSVLITALNAVLHVIVSIYDGVKAAWSLMKGFANFVENASGKVLNFVGIETGSKALSSINEADNSPISLQTPNSIANSSSTNNKTTNVNTGPITINTQATDAEGISSAFSEKMKSQINQTMNDYDDGVLA